MTAAARSPPRSSNSRRASRSSRCSRTTRFWSCSPKPIQTSRLSCLTCGATARTSPRLSEMPGDAERLHVLVADDEPHIGRIIKMKLEQGPFAVTLAYDGREALEALAQDTDVALVMLDL